jgi:thiamine pyrophosphate-dependent acetolactate synthase large subunit-like protein
MKNTTYFWDFISSKNVDNVFGLSGSATVDILSTKPNSIKWTNVGNELQNGFIASVYGYYTKNVGFLFTTVGAGIATALSAYKNAEAEHQPLLVISTFNPLIKEDFKWLTIKQTVDAFGNVIYIEHNYEFITKLHKAYNLALNNTTSVILIINVNILSQTVKAPNSRLLKNNSLDLGYRNKINKINNKIISSFDKKRILVVVGKGSFIDYNVVEQFILDNKLPYVTTWKQRFIIKNSLYCGRFGSLGHHSANYAAIKANRILIIGDISEEIKTPFFTNKFSFVKLNKKSIVYLISNKNTSLENKNIDKYVINDNVNGILSKLKISCSKKWENIVSIGNSNLFNSIQPISKLEKYMYAASQVYKNNSSLHNVRVTTGVGNHWYAVGKYFDISKPESFESTTSWSSIGTGLTNGIGIHYATKEHVWIFEGDGGFLFSSCVFLYLLENPNLPLTITLLVDGTYSSVLQKYVTNNFTNNESNNIPYTNWSKILPNSVTFTNETDYYNYLNENPISNNVRYIILMIDNRELNNSHVYEIQIDRSYIENAARNNFQYLKDKPLTL